MSDKCEYRKVGTSSVDTGNPAYDFNVTIYSTSCGGELEVPNYEALEQCPTCGKPIELKEVINE